MNVLVFGGTGLAGSALIRILTDAGHDVTAPPRQVFDIQRGTPGKSLIQGIDAVINAAVQKAITPETEAASARINSQFPQEIAALCRAAGLPFIQISTDGVFSGQAGPYDEAHAPDPADAYGRQKLAGEPEECMVLRTSLIGPEQAHFTALLCWLLEQKAACPGFTNHLWNGLTSLAFARTVERIIAAGLFTPGIRHLYADDVSKCDLLQMLASNFVQDLEIIPSEAPDPRDRRLRTRHGEFIAALDIPPLATQVAELPAHADERGRWRD